MIYPSVPVMGYKVYSNDLRDIRLDDGMVVINTLNAYSYVRAEEDPMFREALLASDILVADGFPVVLAARLLGGYKIKKIAGADVFIYVLKLLNSTSGSCFFLGSSRSTLEKIKTRMAREYPRITVFTYSPPFRERYTEEENREMIAAVNKANPTAVFVGMTAPKQEKWVFENKGSLNTSLVCSIGAVFDFYAETVTRPSPIWIKLNLEWFVRFIKEPKRLGKRYFVYSPLFLGYLLKFSFKRNKAY
jgi:N-acetylglucosaminyldiphosphoundecaprenol N-acetyl-beta-D-mannosaminyltransferase